LIGIVAFALGLALAAYRGWPVLVIGAASLTAALAYMGGPKPIAYTPFGELTVFVFFGLVAVTGTQWVLTGTFGLMTFLASMAIGGLAAAALAVNNHRDMDHDRLVGRRTFAVVFGAAASQRLYRALLLGPFLIVLVMAACAEAPTLLLPLLILPIGFRLFLDFLRCPPGAAFNQILFRTFRFEIWFAALLSVGALLPACRTDRRSVAASPAFLRTRDLQLKLPVFIASDIAPGVSLVENVQRLTARQRIVLAVRAVGVSPVTEAGKHQKNKSEPKKPAPAKVNRPKNCVSSEVPSKHGPLDNAHDEGFREVPSVR
jgi:hypothetical protein